MLIGDSSCTPPERQRLMPPECIGPVSNTCTCDVHMPATAQACMHTCVLFMLQGGDLRAALDGSNGVEYRWRARGARIAADITRGLAYIHSTGVIHRCTLERGS